MSFSLFLSEGAFPVTADMRQFIKEILEKIRTKNYAYGIIILQRDVDSGKYGIKEVAAKVVKAKKLLGLIPTTDNGEQTKSKNIYMIKVFANWFFYRPSIESKIYATLLHELIHIFDPHPYEYKIPYHDIPSEHTAFLNDNADRFIRDMLRIYNKDQVTDLVRRGEFMKSKYLDKNLIKMFKLRPELIRRFQRCVFDYLTRMDNL